MGERKLFSLLAILKNERGDLFIISKTVGILVGPSFSYGRIRGYVHSRYKKGVSRDYVECTF